MAFGQRSALLGAILKRSSRDADFAARSNRWRTASAGAVSNVAP
jgi:hypothetical protein